MDTGLRLQSLGLADPGTGNTPGLWSLECLWTWDSVLAVRLWSPKHLWTLESVLVVRLWSPYWSSDSGVWKNSKASSESSLAVVT